MKRIEEIKKELAAIRLVAERICKEAPDESECSNAENEVFADLANLVNSIGNIGIGPAECFSADDNEDESVERAGIEGLKPFYVTMRITGRFIPKVYAENVDDSKKKAEDAYVDADFGELEDIDGEVVMVEDEAGNYLWEK